MSTDRKPVADPPGAAVTQGDLDARVRALMRAGLPRYVAAELVAQEAAQPAREPDHCGLCGCPTDGTWDCTSCALDEDAKYID